MKNFLVVFLASLFISLSGVNVSVDAKESIFSGSGAETTATVSEKSKEEELTSSNKSTAEKNTDGWTKIGKTVTVEGIEYTINGFKKSKSSDLFTAGDGNTYLLIDINAKNYTDEEAPLSSILMFELTDGDGKEYDISLFGTACLDEEKIEMIDGSVAAMSEKRGGLAYEIPENAIGLKLTFLGILGDESKSVQLN